jgi:hypothetical protein
MDDRPEKLALVSKEQKRIRTAVFGLIFVFAILVACWILTRG